jgi:large subunit ribosomal protein L11
MPSLKVKSLKAAVKTVIGTCISMGVTIEGKNPKELLAELESGKYDDVLEKAT